MFVTKRPANGRIVCRDWITKKIFFCRKNIGKQCFYQLITLNKMILLVRDDIVAHV